MSVLYETSMAPQVDNETIHINENGELSTTDKVNDNLTPEPNLPDDKRKFLRLDEDGNKVWEDVDIKNLSELEDVILISEVIPEGNENPQENHWYEYDQNDKKYILTTDTTVVPNKRYYKKQVKDKQIIKYDSELKKWINDDPLTRLSKMDDVEITDPKDYDIFVYSNGKKKWINTENKGSRYSIVVTSTDPKLQNDVTITIERVDGGEDPQSAEMVNGQVEFSTRHGGVWKITEPVGNNFFFTEKMVAFGEYFYEISSYKIYGFHVGYIDIGSGVKGKGVTYKIDYEGENPITHEVVSTKVSNYDYEPASMDYDIDEWKWGDWNPNDFFMPRPCLLSQDCTHVIYLHPDNYAKTKEGKTDIEIFGQKQRIIDLLNGLPATNSDGSVKRYYNAMMQWGRENANKDPQQIWYKVVPDSDDLQLASYSVYFASTQVDADFHAWSFYNCDDELIPYFYTAIYNSSQFGAFAPTLPLRSVSNSAGTGTPSETKPILTQNGIYHTQLVPMAKLNNKNLMPGSSNQYYNEWYTDIFADRILINFLTILVTRRLDIQDAVGVGYEQAAVTTATTLGAAGLGNRKGLFYGKYQNADTSRNKTTVSKVFGMENYYGNMSSFVAGLYIYNGNYYIKLTYGTKDGSTGIGWPNLTIASPTTAQAAPENLKYICGTAIHPDLKQTQAAGTKWNNLMMADKTYGILLPIGNTNTGASNKYYCDMVGHGSNAQARSIWNPAFGKIMNLAQADGIPGPFAMDMRYNGASGKSLDGSTRLSCKPKNIPTKIE